MQAIRKYFLKKLIRSLLNEKPLVLLDIGAAGGVEPRWRGLESLLTYIAVEPDPRSAKELSALEFSRKFKNFLILPRALWSKAGNMGLNLCRQLSASSLFEPNAKFIAKFPDSERFIVEKVTEISTTTISECDLPRVDFIKLDTQGAELEILIGAEKYLPSLMGVEVEVQFAEIYKNQPLFGRVSSWLDAKGFIFMDFIHLKRWERDRLKGFGQLIFADALFLRDPDEVLGLETDNIKKYICLCAIYNRMDLIRHVLKASNENLKISKNAKYWIRSLEIIFTLATLFTRGGTWMQRKLFSNFRGHFLY